MIEVVTIERTLTLLLGGKKPDRQLRIGIAGGSGSGKTTVAAQMQAGLRACSVELIGLDRFFKPVTELPKYWSEMYQEERADFNRPDSFRVEEMIEFCGAMSGCEVVLFDGHFVLYYPQLRKLMDIKIFIDADIDEMLRRRTERNLSIGYGGDLEEISNYNKECVMPQFNRHILPTRKYADFVIPNHGASLAERDAIIDSICEAINRR